MTQDSTSKIARQGNRDCQHSEATYRNPASSDNVEESQAHPTWVGGGVASDGILPVAHRLSDGSNELSSTASITIEEIATAAPVDHSEIASGRIRHGSDSSGDSSILLQGIGPAGGFSAPHDSQFHVPATLLSDPIISEHPATSEVSRILSAGSRRHEEVGSSRDLIKPGEAALQESQAHPTWVGGGLTSDGIVPVAQHLSEGSNELSSTASITLEEIATAAPVDHAEIVSGRMRHGSDSSGDSSILLQGIGPAGGFSAPHDSQFHVPATLLSDPIISEHPATSEVSRILSAGSRRHEEVGSSRDLIKPGEAALQESQAHPTWVGGGLTSDGIVPVAQHLSEGSNGLSSTASITLEEIATAAPVDHAEIASGRMRHGSDSSGDSSILLQGIRPAGGFSAPHDSQFHVPATLLSDPIMSEHPATSEVSRILSAGSSSDEVTGTLAALSAQVVSPEAEADQGCMEASAVEASAKPAPAAWLVFFPNA